MFNLKYDTETGEKNRVFSPVSFFVIQLRNICGESASVPMQVASQAHQGVLDEAIAADLEREVHIRKLSSCGGQAHLLVQTDDDRETTAGVVASFAHVRREILGAGIAGQHADSDFFTWDRHHQWAEPFDEGSHAVMPERLTLGSDRAVDLNLCVSWLSRHCFLPKGSYGKISYNEQSSPIVLVPWVTF